MNTQRNDPESPKFSTKTACREMPCHELLWIGLSYTTSATPPTIEHRDSLNPSKHSLHLQPTGRVNPPA